MEPPADILSALGFSAAAHVATTGIAQVWKVLDPNGTPKALKIYNGFDPKDEADGFALMQAADGAGCVGVDQYADGVAVMEWLDGPTAGDLSRAGDDAAGLHALIGAATAMHAAVPNATMHLRPISMDIAALNAATCAPDCPESLKNDIAACKNMGRALLATQGPPRPLHGDLHHDNVIVTLRGPAMFDAKGMLGEAAYEAANMFRNPLGADALIRDQERLIWMANQLGLALHAPPKRLLQWSCVRMALSWVWSYGDTLPADPADADLLPLYLELANVA